MMMKVEILLFMSLAVVFLQQLLEFVALGRRHFKELESWFKIVIFSLGKISSLFHTSLQHYYVVLVYILLIFFDFLKSSLTALTAMLFEDNLAILNVVASASICVAWIEIIFMIGRYPFLGGRFSIMFYSITKRIIQGAVSFIIIIIAFGWAFFIISLGSNGHQFENPWKSLLKIMVMILGEFEFDTLYEVR